MVALASRVPRLDLPGRPRSREYVHGAALGSHQTYRDVGGWDADPPTENNLDDLFVPKPLRERFDLRFVLVIAGSIVRQRPPLTLLGRGDCHAVSRSRRQPEVDRSRRTKQCRNPRGATST